MSDERTTPTPNLPRCPICATGYSASPGANCPACGRAVDPLPAPPEYDFRLRTERRRLDGPVWMALGVIVLSGGLLLSLGAPGLLIPLAMLVVPALVRTSRLSRGRENAPGSALLGMFLAALGVSLLTGLAAGAACFVVCLAAIFVGGNNMSALAPAFIAGGVTALVVFVWLFVALWPRADPAERDPGED
jgi:hypothetical protein